MPNPTEVVTWSDDDWASLLLAIKMQKCTPFLGAGACVPTLPLGGEVAEIWADRYGYPFPDRRNLPRVAQYVATMKGGGFPKMLICNWLGSIQNQRAVEEFSPHRVLASLRLPIYLTTNYDNFMSHALEAELNQPRAVETSLCQWFNARKSRVRRVDLQPTRERPVVFHLHGHVSEPSSIVITEDDYLEFLTLVTEQKALMPAVIEQAFGNSAFMFIGYSLEDMNFRIIFNKLATYFGGNSFTHVAVQLSPQSRSGEPSEEEIEAAHRQVLYLQKRYDRLQIKIYWGDADTFVRELAARRNDTPRQVA